MVNCAQSEGFPVEEEKKRRRLRELWRVKERGGRYQTHVMQDNGGHRDSWTLLCCGYSTITADLSLSDVTPHCQLDNN